jgi:predicted transcriptional regulator
MRDHCKTTWAEDENTQAAVLRQLLELHPGHLTVEELVREVGGGDSFADRDAVVRAVRDLAGAGLLHRSEAFVEPTRAAVRFSDLLDS